MTLPDERTRAVLNTRMFLFDLLNPKLRPKTVRDLERRARACLRHYPGACDMLDPAKAFDRRVAGTWSYGEDVLGVLIKAVGIRPVRYRRRRNDKS